MFKQLHLNIFIVLTFLLLSVKVNSQNNKIVIHASLDETTQQIKIVQDIVYFNSSNDSLKEIYLHNWANAYKDKKTPLAKRFVEAYTKSFHFASDKQRGFSDIKSISVNFESVSWFINEENPDIVKIKLNNALQPNDSIKISSTYIVKVPDSKFTRYGFDNETYNLRYWYLTPAVYKSSQWVLANNLDLDDLFMDYTDYEIQFSIPKSYNLITDLDFSAKSTEKTKVLHLKGEKRKDVELIITKESDYVSYHTQSNSIITNLNSEKLNPAIKTQIVERELKFLSSYLGRFGQEKLLINKIEYEKNPVYGFTQLPSFIAPYSDTFEWDIQFFKILSRKVIQVLFNNDLRNDAWLTDGLQTYLMMKYVEKYYPEVRAIGDASKIWGIRNFNLAKIDFNEKYSIVNQFATRKNLDQALTTRADSLSNFNRKIVNKYKAGLGIRYLEEYVGEDAIKEAIKLYTKINYQNFSSSNTFVDLIKTDKDLTWFTDDFVTTNKKIDYTIKKIEKDKDSLHVEILNKRNFTAPIKLYGIKDKEIKYEKWLHNVDSSTTVTIPRDHFDRLSLNYEFLLPENNLRNNWQNVDSKIFNRPLQLKFLKDVENPYYNQFFYTPVFRYNYYDGLVLGLAISNKTILNKNFVYKITPSYSTKSQSLSGSASFVYEYLPENKDVNRFLAGIQGSTFHYNENLNYTSIVPFMRLEFTRKDLRDVSNSSIYSSYTMVDKEIDPLSTAHSETYNYGVLSLGYAYTKPAIIEDIRFSTEFQTSSKFSKLSLTSRYRKLTDANTQIDFRFFAGVFLRNKTQTDFFSFALDRPTDYLFQYDFIGRSETTGFISQQIIINEGGFKSQLPVPYANEWLTTLNSSFGIWRWLEFYNDVGFVKNRGNSVYFAYENGIRLNFVQDILEFYFPLYSNLGWETSQANYNSKIRFVLVIKPKKIYNFIRRGFY